MELVFLVPLAFFAALTFIVKWSLEHSRWKKQYQAGPSSSENSFGKSELKALIREAVAEANEPMLDRVEALEAHLDALTDSRLLAARQAPLLEEAIEAYEAEANPVRRPRRVS